MFSVNSSQTAIVLEGQGNKLEIWPSCGAILNAWTVETNQGSLALIDGYESEADFADFAEQKGFRSCKLSPYVCRMAPRGFEFDGKQYDIGKYKLGATSIHGLLYNLPFAVVAQVENEHLAAVTLVCDYEGTDVGFPFAYTAEVTYTLEAGNRVTLHTKVTNRSDGTMPISDGWHPYFTFGVPLDELKISFAREALVEFDDALLPTGRLLPVVGFRSPESLQDVVFDNCFLLERPLTGAACRLSSPAHQLAIAIYPDTSYPYLQLYTPPHRQSIAIENLSSAPNAFNNGMGLQVLEPNASIDFSTTYVLEALG